jgi:hypothetical protein
VTRVAVVLKRELDSTIKEWLRHVKLIPDLMAIPLSDADRTRHLPKLFDDLIWRRVKRSSSGFANTAWKADFSSEMGANLLIRHLFAL